MKKIRPIATLKESRNATPSLFSSPICESVADQDDHIRKAVMLDIRDQPYGCFISRTGCAATLGAIILVLLAITISLPNLIDCGVSVQSHYKPTLRFTQVDNQTWKFKILQIADIHLGEAEDTDWGPEQDRKTWIVLDKLISLESPDLMVLSGDQVTANNCESNATEYYRLLGQFLSRYGIPWATIFGNHDDLDFEIPGTNLTKPAKYSRKDLLEMDQSFLLSLTQEGPSNVFGTTNYVLDIPMGDRPAAQIIFLDTGGGSLPQAIQQSQVEWLEKECLFSSNLPAVAFQHIPTQDFHFNEDVCQGFHGEGVGSVDFDAGIVQALSNSGRVHFLGVGHNHGNDYCCPYSDTKLHVCYGRHSGYGGYGTWERGARVYELTIHEEDPYHALHWKSWVRLESGRIVDEVSYS
jgi:hypothetical protein